jgi:hypothetical protein
LQISASIARASSHLPSFVSSHARQVVARNSYDFEPHPQRGRDSRTEVSFGFGFIAHPPVDLASLPERPKDRDFLFPDRGQGPFDRGERFF